MSYQTVVLADSPASFFWLNDTNTTAVDTQAVQNGVYAGTYTQSQPSLVNGGQAATLFDGASGTVSVANNANQQPGTGAWSLECWFKPAALSGTQGIAIKDVSTGYGNQPWGFSTGTNTVTFGICVSSNTTYSVNHNTTIANGQVYHVVGVFDPIANTIIIYLNGNLGTNTTTTTGSIGSPTGVVRFGQQKNGTNRWFNGTINAIAWYPTGLTAAKVKAHWQAGIASHRFMQFFEQ